jgi:hypothetical protein
MPKGFLGVAYDIRRVTEIFDVKYLKQESECMDVRNIGYILILKSYFRQKINYNLQCLFLYFEN